jgi:hypothetical protein
MAAKLVASGIGGIAFGLAAAASTVLSSALILEMSGEQLVWDDESRLIVVGVFAVSALAAPWGMLIGWIVRSPVAALAGIMAWTLIAESAIIALAPDVGRFLPGGAQRRSTGNSKADPGDAVGLRAPPRLDGARRGRRPHPHPQRDLA